MTDGTNRKSVVEIVAVMQDLVSFPLTRLCAVHIIFKSIYNSKINVNYILVKKGNNI